MRGLDHDRGHGLAVTSDSELPVSGWRVAEALRREEKRTESAEVSLDVV